MDMRRLSPGQREALRMRMMGPLRDGMTSAVAQRVFGVSEGAIRDWRNRFAAGGGEGLPGGSAGPGCRWRGEADVVAGAGAGGRVDRVQPEATGFGRVVVDVAVGRRVHRAGTSSRIGN